MPLIAVPCDWLGVTVSPPSTAADSVTVKVMSSPSLALASLTVTVALSSLVIVPMPESVAVTSDLEAVRLTVKVSFSSTTTSSVVDTVNVFVSFAVPVKLRAVVLVV